MIGRPERDEASPYYFTYIDQTSGDDVVSILESQLQEIGAEISSISEEKSLHRYAPDKWSIRQMWSHINDTERVMVFRALWFARGFDTALPSFDQNVAVAAAKAEEVPWARHVEEFRAIRLTTVSFFRQLPAEAWIRRGIASDHPFTVRALAYLTAGHTIHHLAILRDRYLES